MKYAFDEVSGTMQPVEEIEEKKPVNEKPVEQSEISLDLSAPRKQIDPNEPIVQFYEKTDFSILQISDEKTGRPMMVIGGYGLEIKFNMAELRTTEKIEQLLAGLTNVFRTLIVKQAISK